MTLYAERNARALEPYLSRHMLAMTEEELHNKGDIAIELAWRDQQIERLRALLSEARDDIRDEVEANYPWKDRYPCLVSFGIRDDDLRRYRRDMEIVHRIDAALAATDPHA